MSDGRARLERMGKDLLTNLADAISNSHGLAVVKAPPGSGKTHTLLQLVAVEYQRGQRIAVGTQTNAQADDICRRIAHDYPHLPAYRFVASGSRGEGGPVPVVSSAKDLPHRCIAVGTVAKWGMINIPEPFDVLMLDEAWQMAWADFMLCGQVAPKFVLIGDPGQISPVVSIPVHRWETSPRAPHHPAPELILADPALKKFHGDLPACRRLPADAVDLIRGFYDFEFESWAKPGERYVAAPRPRDGGDLVDGAIDLLAEGSASSLNLATPDDGPPFERDLDIAHLAVRVASRLIDRSAKACDDDTGKTRPLAPEDIGITATHRVMNGAIERALPGKLRGKVKVDTAERWQGLERKVMIVIHPLSSIVHPSAFDLETGRLCVMASRHRSGMIVISRDHVPDTLSSHIPAAEQAIGRPDITGRGHEAHIQFWSAIEEADRIQRIA
jgi:AAA domain-containing protein